MPAKFPDFGDRAVYYRELAAREENVERASALFDLAKLFERMARDFADHFPQSHAHHQGSSLE